MGKTAARSEEIRTGSSPDAVSLSAVSETLLHEVDNTEKVNALKAAYEAGSYEVDAGELAKCMLKADFAPSKTDANRQPDPK